MAVLHAVSRIMDDSKSDILAVNRFTSNPANKISSSFSDLHTTLKFIDQQKKESIRAQQKILKLRKDIVEATICGWVQVTANLQREVGKLLPIAYATNLT